MRSGSTSRSAKSAAWHASSAPPRESAQIEHIDGRPVATAFTILVGAVIMVIARAVPLSLENSVGAIVGPVGSELWRYVTAPFVYSDVGAFLA